jgi:hypothetical protein
MDRINQHPRFESLPDPELRVFQARFYELLPLVLDWAFRGEL